MNAQETRRKPTGAPIRDLAGLRSGRLVAVEPTEERRSSGEVVWLALCDCGNTARVSGRVLVLGQTQSCGCLGRRGTGNGHSGTGQRRESARKIVITDGSRAFRNLFTVYARSASNRNIPFALEEGDFRRLVALHCDYCGIEPSQTWKYKEDVFLYNGIDRVDSARGYTVDNCVPCCGPCNMAKGEMSPEKFREHISRIYRHLESKSA